MNKFITLILVTALSALHLMAQESRARAPRPFVNQAGYNLDEAKRFTCPGAPDGTPFSIYAHGTNSSRPLFTGTIKGEAGDFTAFNPAPSGTEYVIKVKGFGRSVPFWIADHLMEKLSSRLAYQFFIDVRGGFTPQLSPANVTGGGPSRDGGGQGLEATFEGLLYASNPALFDRWNKELRYYDNRLYPIIPPPDDEPLELKEYHEKKVAELQDRPDLVKLILWHAEWAYNNHQYKGHTGGFSGRADGYETWVRQFGSDDGSLQSFDYQNLLDQLAAVCAFYHSLLKPYLSRETYQKYRQACLDKWEAYDRHQEVRYWVKSRKWIDEGRLEFNEQGSAFGQGLLRNLLMYLSERNEPDGQPERFLKYAQGCAADMIKNWDFNNPVHTWRARNAEHITPQALALFLITAPEHAPAGAKEKLAAWRDYILKRTDNLWHYRTHSDTEWAHPKSKEVGTVAGLGGAIFAVASVLGDEKLRAIGWSQVNFVFGCNPAGAHLSNKSALRVAMKGYWDGVEVGWPFSYVHGTGVLGAVRGTLDGSPTNAAFPYHPEKAASGDKPGVYGTEGWSITNRAWMGTVTFSTAGSHRLRLLDPKTGKEISSAKLSDTVRVELKAALNQDWRKAETGWVEVIVDEGRSKQRLTVTETGPNTGIFTGEFKVSDLKNQTAVLAGSGQFPKKVTVSYGYLGFTKSATLSVGER